MGFADELSQILRNLPMKRVQKLLFSATAKKSLEKYAKSTLSSDFNYFSLNNYEDSLSQALEGNPEIPEEGKTDEEDRVAKYVTPIKLTHFYMCINAQDKLDTLFSFIKSHKDSKCIVFFSSCKQVRYAYESFNKLKTGSTIMEIHGRQKQVKRTAIYFEFVERKKAFLFATDIASRGMDFPAVDWVIQVDIPEDTDTYIHRVGRTARYKYKGSSLLMTQPHEMKFVEKLTKLNINMKKLKANPNRTMSITSALQRINAENSELMHLAQKSFVCYIRSVFKNGDKEVFDISKIDHEALANSFGLVTAPVIEFVQGDELKKGDKKSKLQKLKEKIKQRKLAKMAKNGDQEMEPDQPEEQEDQEEEEQVSESEEEPKPAQPESDQDEDLFTVKRRIAPDEDIEEEEDQFESRKIFSKNALKKIRKGGISQGKNKMYFDAEGKPMTSLEYHMQQDTFKNKGKEAEEEIVPEQYFSQIKQSLTQNKEIDDQIALDRLKKLRQKRKRQRAEREAFKDSNRYMDSDDEGEGEGDQDEEDQEEDAQQQPKVKNTNKRAKKQEASSEEESSEDPEDL